MIRSLFAAITLIFAFSVASPTAAAVVYVRYGPPAARVERVGVRPGPGYVWVGGYYRWYGGTYVWAPGAWVRHAGAWCAGHWRHVAGSGWYWIPGHWC